MTQDESVKIILGLTTFVADVSGQEASLCANTHLALFVGYAYPEYTHLVLEVLSNEAKELVAELAKGFIEEYPIRDTL